MQVPSLNHCLEFQLSAPSVVFAEASWYGSLRGGLHVGGGADGQFFDGGSRWGVKGSAEASEGLTAVYRFEASVSTKDASQGGRLAYAGLSGGFGSISLGQVWNAAYNHVGVITDKSYYFGNAGTGYRHGNALSYAFSSGALGFQLDLISDGSMDTGKAIDKTEFGVTIGLGEVGKVALAHTNVRDKSVVKMTKYVHSVPGTPYVPAVPGTPAVEAVPEKYYVTVGTGDDAMEHQVHMIMVKVAQGDIASHLDTDGTKLIEAGLNAVLRDPDGAYRTGDVTGCAAAAETADTADDCKDVTAYVHRRDVSTSTDVSGENTSQDRTTVVRETFYAETTRTEDAVNPVSAGEGTSAVPGRKGTPEQLPMPYKDTDPGHKTTHVAVEFSVGGVTPYLGYSKEKVNGQTDETKTTHYGLSGSLGDTGMGYLVAGRSIKDTDGMKTSPWLVNVWKGLGGGATVIFGHGNDDNGKSGKSRVGLHVSF